MHLNLSGSRKKLHMYKKFMDILVCKHHVLCEFSQMCHNLLHACIFPFKSPLCVYQSHKLLLANFMYRLGILGFLNVVLK